MKKYPILQSGFIVKSDFNLKHPDHARNLSTDFLLNKDHLKNTNHFFYNSIINDLFEEWNKDKSILRDFDFREKVLIVANNIFECKYIDEWLTLQSNYGQLTDLHIKFIEETVDYVIHDIHRTISPIQWNSLLEPNSKLSNIKKYSNKPIPETYRITDFIKDWTDNDNGFEDLICTLYVIYGKSTNITNVQNNHSLD